MKLQQVSDHCYATLNETNLICDANSGLINIGPGMVVDTQSDLPHARKMIELFGTVWTGMPRYVALTHEDIDHVAGNQLFPGAEIIAHRAVAERIATVADPSESEKLTHSVHQLIARTVLREAHPGVLAVARQMDASFDFEGIEVVVPTTVFEVDYEVDLDGTKVQLLHVGAAHQEGDAMVHVPSEGVLFSGDLLFNESTPMGWVGSYQAFSDALDRIVELAPETIVPGHGPVCGLDAVRAEQAYFASVLAQAKECFDQGLSARDAAARIDLGPYAEWKAPSRLLLNVERAYREFQGDPLDTPYDLPKLFDGMYHLAKDRNLPVEF